jgi:hypothetical protein
MMEFPEEEDMYARHGNVFNGSTKFINWMLTLIVGLLLAGITGQIYFNNNITEQITKIRTTQELMIEGRIKIGP